MLLLSGQIARPAAASSFRGRVRCEQEDLQHGPGREGMYDGPGRRLELRRRFTNLSPGNALDVLPQ